MDLAFAELSTLAVAGWGAAGAALWLLLVFGLPIAWQAVQGEVDWYPDTQRVLGLVGLIGGYLVLGGVAPLIVSADELKEAVGYGLGWQGIFGQYVKPPSGE